MTGASAPLGLAADIGGTFTDVVAERGHQRVSAKVLTTHDAPERALLDGVTQALDALGASFAEVAQFVHGTTLATNAIIERKGAVTALIATEGFRDVIAIADESRHAQYDLNIERNPPLVPRRLRFTVPERMDVTGQPLLELDEDALRQVARDALAAGAQAIAVAFLHAYANPAHERRAREILADIAPDLPVSISSEVCPEIREYERTSTTIANAYVQPLMAGYLTRLARALADRGCQAPLRLMTSGGALASIDAACRFPVRLVESGPAGGAILAGHIAAASGEDRVLSFDMGGTTAKICLIEDGRPQTARTFEVDRTARFLKGSGLPIRIPVIEMIEIGAGGGSIAAIDATQSITVGPESAGSEPGPAAYGRGGTQPTVTDADVVLGRIAPDRFAGRTLSLNADAAAKALNDTIATPLGLETEMGALGVTEMVDETMSNAARVHAVERGATLKTHSLIAFGGAAPLHAARVAEKLGLARVIIPADAGVGSAVGFLRAPVAFESTRSRFMRLDTFDAAAATALLDEMTAETTDLASGATGPLVQRRTAFMRYAGQGHEISVDLPIAPLTGADADTLRTAFETAYRRLFERHIPSAAIEILSWSVFVGAETEAPTPPDPVPPLPAPEAPGHRRIFDATTRSWGEVPVHERDALHPGTCLPGPALIVENATSTYVTARFDARVDGLNALILDRKTEAP
ncbi:MAG: methylhydantoinase [Rhodobacteraceae bacterium]|nr:methylhydantoinase [Paracoccaceae bacterium]